jgi:probable O-glycosylation ligase (exosortase A-associated)
MYPHRLAYGAAHNFPFSQVIAILTLIGLLVTNEHRRPKGGAAAVMLAVLLAWSAFAQIFAFHPTDALMYLDRVAKVCVMTWVILLLIHTRQQVEAMLWCLVVAVGFYSTKGGLFVLLTGGAHMVYGPPNSPLDGNNSIAVATVVVIPLMYYLLQVSRHRLIQLGLAAVMALSAVSVLGSYSRGALLAILAMGCLLWLHGKHKALLAVAAIIFVTVAIPFMPAQWTTRMNTIQNYELELSAMQRIWAWETAYNIAKVHFPVAGGFEFQSPQTSAKYSPNPDYFHVAHSIYFQVLGSLGFIGLGIFLTFWWLVWRQTSWLRTHGRGEPDLQWSHQLGSLAQVSLVGYFVGGAFLDLAFWDLPYYLFAAVAGTKFAVAEARSAAKATQDTPLAAGAFGPSVAPPQL